MYTALVQSITLGLPFQMMASAFSAPLAPPCRAAGVPTDVEFRPKWQIALEQIVRLQADGVPTAPVIADAGYGVVTAFRDQLTAAAIPYAAGMTGDTTV